MTNNKVLRWALLGLALAALAALAVVSKGLLPRALEYAAGLGPAGLGVFVALYVAAALLFLPASLLTLGAGAIYGLAKGFALVSAASTLAAAAAFLVSRHAARDWVHHRMEKWPKFKAVESAVSREGWKIVFLARLSPAFPFNFLNYGLGLTSIRFRDYVLASWVGMMPGTALYVYLGSAAGNLAHLAGGARSRSAWEWSAYGLGLAATIGVTALVTRAAKKAMQEKTA